MSVHNAEFPGLDDLAVLLVIKEPAYDGVLGHDGVKPGLQAQILRCLGHVPAKAGAVVIIDGDNAILHLRRHFHSGVYRQIAALGMAAHDKGAGAFFALVPEIRRSVLLGGNHILHAQEKVLFPRHYGVAGAAKGDKPRAVRQQHGQRGELLLTNHVDFVYIIAYFQLAEPLGMRQAVEHLNEIIGAERTQRGLRLIVAQRLHILPYGVGHEHFAVLRDNA